MDKKTIDNTLSRLHDYNITNIILSNAPFGDQKSITFPEFGFNYAFYKLSKKYPETFKGFHFVPVDESKKLYRSKQLEDIKFFLGASGVLCTLSPRFKDFYLTKEMALQLSKDKEKLNKTQKDALKIISNNYWKYLKQYQETN